MVQHVYVHVHVHAHTRVPVRMHACVQCMHMHVLHACMRMQQRTVPD